MYFQLGNEKQDLEKEVSALGQERGQLKAELNAANQRLVNEVKKADHQEEVVQQLTTRLQGKTTGRHFGFEGYT